MQTFTQKVYNVVKRIPAGETLSYKQVAVLAGNPKACRAVGSILHRNIDPAVPCHRVVRSDGEIGGYNRGVQNKIKILKREGAMKNKLWTKKQ